MKIKTLPKQLKNKLDLLLQVRKDFMILFILIALISISGAVYMINPVQAATVTGYVSYTQANGCVSKDTATITINDTTEKPNFEAGIGITKGTEVVYKKASTSPLYICCLEQTGLTGKDVKNCENVTAPAPNTGSKNPWMSTSQGTFYLKYGKLYPGKPVSGYFSTNKNEASLSEYTYSTKWPLTKVQTTPITTDQLSFEQYTLFNYSSNATQPPALSGYDGWYDYLKKLAKVNVLNDKIKNFSAPKQSAATISGNFSNYFQAAANPKVYEITGNVTVNSGAVCDTEALIYVGGNLTVNPGVTIGNKAVTFDGSKITGNACMFIVKGTTTIKGGAAATSTSAGNFDILETAIISQGKTVIEYDGGDALKVSGLLSGTYGDYQRHTDDDNRPSVWIEYDPRYAQIFKDELKVDRFSTKEKGFVAGLF